MNKKRTVLVDLSRLKYLYSGLGQLAFNYGQYFKETYKAEYAAYDLTLLVPENWIGKFGNEVKYISPTVFFKKNFSFLYPKFDVWHATQQLTRHNPPCSKKTKYILTIHDLNYLYERTGFSRYRKNFILQKKINRADQIICISAFTQSEVEKNLNLGIKPCRIIYNGVELMDFSKAKAPEIEISKPFFFTIGVVQHKKNFHVLLDFMKLMPDMHLYIAGKDDKGKKNSYSDYIQHRIDSEKITNVTLLGAISHYEKIWYYTHCKAFLFPSLFEGFGLPVIEAMQAGKPVFSSTETSLREIGGRFSFFWDNFEPNAMKERVTLGLNEFETNANYAKEQIEYATSFSFIKHFEEYEKLYTTI